MGLRNSAPLLDAWIRDITSERFPFQIPGHKGRIDLTGPVVEGDIPVLPGNHPNRISPSLILEAEALAAKLWGADLCRFGVNGSTGTNHASVMAVAGPGDKVIVSRTLHKSVLVGMVYAGVVPIWVRPEINLQTGLPEYLPSSRLRETLEQHPDAKAVLIGEPSYVGTMSNIPRLSSVCHQYGIPLVVDAAWAAHFGFHPDLPKNPLDEGADIVVTSAHKTLPSYSQASFVLAKGDYVDLPRLNKAFDSTQTTSMSGRILASIDAARALMQRHGAELIGPVIEATAKGRQALREAGIGVIDGQFIDPLKLVILLNQTGADGNLVEAELLSANIDLEMANRDVIIPMITMADTPDRIANLVKRIIELVQKHRGEPRPVKIAAAFSIEPEVVITPRDAFFAPYEVVSGSDAIGRVSAELICPYPPGVPVLSPGERITESAMTALLEARDSGIRIAFVSDPSLLTFKVLRDN
ncbi:aminotransferase class V-fold PLP-dependent enzyme [Aquiluna borgnonia]|uniref:Aminotransferase class V-fold PLP-dependent enzyme n=2 Tax=Aquiluna borgnonia TaxID=2499157 RepID=A0A7D4UBG7_9MICO|nr:aminotransferase class V-fold PLP-dependent enzyme [Aquiluna borgnonia]